MRACPRAFAEPVGASDKFVVRVSRCALEEVRIVVQMEAAFTVLGAVAGLYGFYVKGCTGRHW